VLASDPECRIRVLPRAETNASHGGERRGSYRGPRQLDNAPADAHPVSGERLSSWRTVRPADEQGILPPYTFNMSDSEPTTFLRDVLALRDILQVGEVVLDPRDVIESMADGLIVAGPNGRFLLFNPAAERLLGMGLLDVPPSDYAAAYGLFLPDTVTPCPAALLPPVSQITEVPFGDLELFVRNPGVPRGVWLGVTRTPLSDPNGTIYGTGALIRDITAQRRARDEAESLSKVVEQTADTVVITDPSGRIEYVNPAFEATTGYSRAEALGARPSLLKSGAHPPEFYARMWKTVSEGRVFRGTLTNRKKDGQLFLFEQTITPMRGPDGTITRLVSVAKDVTEQRKAARREGTLLLARSIQQRFYPTDQPRVPGFDIAGAAFVADEVGGDYFDFIPMPDDQVGIVIADVSGHGIDSALLMAEARAVLRSTVQAMSDPGEVLTVVNRVVARDMDDNRFTTMLLARLDPFTRTVTYASAGHYPGYVLDQSGAVKAELQATGLPLGPFAAAREILSEHLTLEPGDVLVLVTDGVSESEAPDGSFFEMARALEVMQSCLDRRATEIVGRLYSATRTFADGVPQNDDITIVVCKALS
jgi:PAS domain S-box-containing protein